MKQKVILEFNLDQIRYSARLLVERRNGSWKVKMTDSYIPIFSLSRMDSEGKVKMVR